MNLFQYWDKNQISMGEWTKLVCGEAESKERTVYLDRGYIVKKASPGPIVLGQLISIKEIWTFTLEIFTRNRQEHETRRQLGPIVLQSIKVLVAGQDASSPDDKELALEINSINLDISEEQLLGAAEPKMENALIKALILGANLSKTVKEGLNVWAYAMAAWRDTKKVIDLFFEWGDIHDALQPLKEGDNFCDVLINYCMTDTENTEYYLTIFRKIAEKLLPFPKEEQTKLFRSIITSLGVGMNQKTYKEILGCFPREFLNLPIFSCGTILHNYAGFKIDNIEMFVCYFDLGVDLTILNEKGETPLHIAARVDNYLVIKFLIDAKADLNIRNQDGLRPFDVSEGQSHRLLGLAGAMDCNGNNLLFNAIETGDDKLAAELIAGNFPINMKNWRDDTPLTLAVEKGQYKIVELLLKKGAEVVTDSPYELFLSKVSLVKNEKYLQELKFYLELSGLFIERGARSKTFTNLMLQAWIGNAGVIAQKIKETNFDKEKAQINQALMLAVNMGHHQVVKVLIEAGADINAGDPLDIAIKNRQTECIDLLLGATLTPQHLNRAILNRDPITVGKLIQRGINVNASDFARTAFQADDLESLNLLIKAGPKVGNLLAEAITFKPHFIKPLIASGLDCRDQQGNTVLHFAVLNRKIDALNTVLIELENLKEKYGEDFITNFLNIKNSSGETALKCAALYVKDAAIVKRLIAAKADVNLGEMGLVINDYDPESFRLLVEAGANLSDDFLIQAVKQKKSELVKVLVHFDLPHNIDSAFQVAIANRDAACLKVLIQGVKGHVDYSLVHQGICKYAELLPCMFEAGVDVNIPDLTTGDTPLHRAVDHNHYVVVELLLNTKKVKVHAKNKKGQTPWDLVLAKDDKTNLYKFCASQAAMEARDVEGQTALIKAIRCNKTLEALIMLKTKQNLNIKDYKGDSALFWAAYCCMTDVVKELIKYGADVDLEDNYERNSVRYLYDEITRLENYIAEGKDVGKNQAKISTYRKIIGILLEAGARDEYGRTPLMRMLQKPGLTTEEFQKWFSQHKHDINAVDFEGRTAAMYAVMHDNQQILKVLWDAKADFTLQNIYGETALAIAIKNEKTNVIPFLFPGSSLNLHVFPFQRSLLKGEHIEYIAEHLVSQFVSLKDFKISGLLVPMYLRHIKLAKSMWRRLNEHERIDVAQILRGNFPQYNLGWLFNILIEFKASHFTVVEEIVPAPAVKPDLDSLLTMFKEINIKDRKAPGYLNPDYLKDDGATKTLAQIQESLELLVNRIKAKKEPFLATPDKGTKELTEFYVKLENALALIIAKLQDPKTDPDIRTSCLFDLAVAGGHCGARYKSEIGAWYRFFTRGTDQLTLEEEILRILQNMRIGVVEGMVKRLKWVSGRLLSIGNRPHYYNQIVRSIGKEIGVPGVSETYDDKAFWLKELSEDFLKRLFFEEYEPIKVIDRIHTALNGVFKDGKRVPDTMEINPALVDYWLKKTMPMDWKVNETFEFTCDDEGNHYTYRAFSKKIKESLETEKQRLSTLSAEEILADCRTKIKGFLLQKGVKLSSEVNLQSWEDVFKAMKEINSGRVKSLLENSEILAEIKSLIESLKDAKGYINYMLGRVLINRFSIKHVPANPQDWEAVQQVLEHMRRQEYVDKEIRINGFIPMQKIYEMLYTMGVFGQ